MAQFNYEEYEARQQRKAAGSAQGKKDLVSYFSLKEDGEEAIVRFAYSSPRDIELVTTHVVKDGKRPVTVSCLRGPYDPIDNCPLCAVDNKVQTRFFVKMLSYVRNPETNAVEIKPVVWNRPASFAKILKGYMDEYGDLKQFVFKVKRHGVQGDMKTSYDILPANPAVYNPESYKQDFNLFEGYSLENSFAGYQTKTAEELKEFLQTGTFYKKTEVEQESTPSSFDRMPAASTSDEEAENISVERPRRYTY